MALGEERVRCAACGTELNAGARFCSECGAPQPAAQPAAPAWPSPVAEPDPWSTPPPPPPQPPPVQQQWPAAQDYEQMRRIQAEQRSFTTPAIITLVLYFVFWLPGLIANIVYWNEANSIQRRTGRAPEGKGCLVAMFWVFILLPVLAFCLFAALSGSFALV